MDQEHVISAQELADKPKEKLSTGKKVLIIIAVVFSLLLITAASFFLGRKSKTKSEEAISPTPTETLTEPLFEFQETSPTPTATSSASPTQGLTATPTPTIKTKIINSVKSLDGFRSSNGGGNNSLEIRAGRNVNLVTRGFVTFNLSDLPAGVTVEEATLRLYQAKIFGNPYSAGGALKVDHLTYGDSLDSSDYALPALLSNIATLTTNAVIEWKDASVTSAVKDDLSNGRSRSQFRIHFTTEVAGGDVTGDFAYFDSANDYSGNTGHTPQLIIKYY